MVKNIINVNIVRWSFKKAKNLEDIVKKYIPLLGIKK